MKSRAIGIFGGSFDPVHHGHLILARDALEQLRLERIIFVPAKISPHKLDRPPSPPELRLGLLRAAIEGEPRFSVDPLELSREGPSFAIDTVRAFCAAMPDAEFFYFIGDDNLEELHTWKDIGELKKLARFAVFTRGGHAIPDGWPSIHRRIEISSTEIRKRIAAGASVRYMVPENVRAILENP